MNQIVSSTLFYSSLKRYVNVTFYSNVLLDLSLWWLKSQRRVQGTTALLWRMFWQWINLVNDTCKWKMSISYI